MNITLDKLTSDVLAAPMRHALAHHAGGGRVIGFVSSDVPVELILAADAAAVCLSAGTASPTSRADSYLESSFAPVERSIAEQWLKGDLLFLSHVVLSRARDSSQRLYYYICELQRRGLCPGPAAIRTGFGQTGRRRTGRTPAVRAPQSCRRVGCHSCAAAEGP